MTLKETLLAKIDELLESHSVKPPIMSDSGVFQYSLGDKLGFVRFSPDHIGVFIEHTLVYEFRNDEARRLLSKLVGGTRKLLATFSGVIKMSNQESLDKLLTSIRELEGTPGNESYCKGHAYKLHKALAEIVQVFLDCPAAGGCCTGAANNIAKEFYEEIHR